MGWRSAQAKRDGNAALLNGRIEREHEAEEVSLLQSGQQVIRIKRKRGAEEPVDTMRASPTSASDLTHLYVLFCWRRYDCDVPEAAAEREGMIATLLLMPDLLMLLQNCLSSL